MSNIVSKIPTVARVLLGLIFAVFGLNGFLHFIPTPPMSGPAGAFGGAMFATGYLFQLLKSTEVIAGLLLLSNRFVPLALALLAPVVVNIVAFHTFLAPSGLPLPLVILALEIYLARSYREAYSGMLHARTEPTRASPALGRPGIHAHAR
jgi:uncharacterized membrane protein YphA (DoxX/SURF4 family)